MKVRVEMVLDNVDPAEVGANNNNDALNRIYERLTDFASERFGDVITCSVEEG